MSKSTTATKKKPRFVARQYINGCANSYAVFQLKDVKRFKGVVPAFEDAVPFRGYENLTREYAECVVERLEKEL